MHADCVHYAYMSIADHVNVRLDRHTYDGLGHLAASLEALPEYRGLKLSKAKVAQMALARGIVALEEDARAAGSVKGRSARGTKGGK